MATPVITAQVATAATTDWPRGTPMALNASWQRRPAAPVRAAHHATALTPATPGQCANHRPTLTMAGSDQLFWIGGKGVDVGGPVARVERRHLG